MFQEKFTLSPSLPLCGPHLENSFFQFTASQEIKVKGILGGLSGGLSITGFCSNPI